MPKKPLDANKPRGPVTAYALFVRTCRDELRRKYPQLTVDYNVIARKCSDRWKSMNETEKKRFNDTADSQRKRYKEELATYQKDLLAKQHPSATSSILLQPPSSQYRVDPSNVIQTHPLLMATPTLQQTTTSQTSLPKKPTKKRERKPKDPHAPKKPLSAYFLFCADERPKVHSSQAGKSLLVLSFVPDRSKFEPVTRTSTDISARVHRLREACVVYDILSVSFAFRYVSQ